jgi:hypothetical protein
MEPVLLMLDVVGMVIVLVWAARGAGREGLFAWRPTPPPGRRKP